MANIEQTIEFVFKARNDAAQTIRELQSQILKVGVGTPEAERLTKSLNDSVRAYRQLGIEARAIEGTGKSAAAANRPMDELKRNVAALPGLTNQAKSALIGLLHDVSQGDYSRLGGGFKDLAVALGEAGATLGGKGAAIAGAAALLGTLASAMVEGQSEARALGKDLVQTGSFAGLTADQLRSLGDSLADLTNQRIGDVRDVMRTLVESGQFTSASLGSVARAVVALADVSSKNANEVAGDFTQMGSDVARWAADANSHYHFLTLTQYEHIRALQQQGKTQDAIAATADRLAESLEKQRKPLGLLPQMWHDLGAAVSTAWDAMKQWGDGPTLDQQIEKLDARLKEMRTVAAGRGSTRELSAAQIQQRFQQQTRAGTFNEYDALQTQRDRLAAQRDAEQAAAAERSAAAQREQEAIGDAERLRQLREQYAGQELDRVGAHLESVAALQKARDDEERVRLDEKLKNHELSYSEYYAKLSAMAVAEAQKDMDVQAIKLRQLDERGQVLSGRPTASASDVAERDAQLNALAAQREGIEGRITVLKQQQAAMERGVMVQTQGALKQLDDRIEAIKARLAKLTGDVSSEDKNKLQQQYQNVIDDARLNRPGEVATLVKALGLDQAKLDLDAIAAKVASIRDGLQSKQTSIQAQVQSGALDTSSARSQLAIAGADAAARLQAAQAELKNLQPAIDQGLDASDLKRQIEDLKVSINSLSKTQFDQLLDRWRNTMSQMEAASVSWTERSADALTKFVTTGKLNFREFANSIIADLARIQIERALSLALGGSKGSGGLLGLVASGLGSAIGGAVGGAPASTGSSGFNFGTSEGSIAANLYGPGHADGGLITGPGTDTSDSIPASVPAGSFIIRAAAVERAGRSNLDRLVSSSRSHGMVPVRLSNGEYWVSPEATQRLGIRLMQSINNGTSRYSEGGFVGTQQAGTATSFQVSIPIPINISGAGEPKQADVDALGLRMTAQMEPVARAVILDEMRPGGSLARLMGRQV